MSYQPKSEEQLAKEGLLPDGEYDFEVVETWDKPSKAGNAMYTLKLHIFSEDGGTQIVTDYIALGSNFGERKLRHAADACRLIDVYEIGNLKPSDFQGKTGRVQIKIQEGNNEFPNPKNAVKDYVKRPKAETEETGAMTPQEKAKAALEGDGIPF